MWLHAQRPARRVARRKGLGDCLVNAPVVIPRLAAGHRSSLTMEPHKPNLSHAKDAMIFFFELLVLLEIIIRRETQHVHLLAARKFL
jgi:hypothetical protein